MAKIDKSQMQRDYQDFITALGHNIENGVDVTHDGYPLSVKEAKFIDVFIGNGDYYKALRESGLNHKKIAGKNYITDEIAYRLDLLKKETIADADEILQYLTSVMRGEIKDQFGLDAPLSERTSAAKELAKRIIDVEEKVSENVVPELKITLNWED